MLDWDGHTENQPTWFAGDGIHLTFAGAVGLATFIKNGSTQQPAIGRCRPPSALTGAPDSGPPLGEPFDRPHRASCRSSRSACSTHEIPHWVAPTEARRWSHGGHRCQRHRARPMPSATVFSVTAADSCAAGFLTVFACGGRPPTSNINYEVGRTTAGLAITPMTAGKVVHLRLEPRPT